MHWLRKCRTVVLLGVGVCLSTAGAAVRSGPPLRGETNGRAATDVAGSLEVVTCPMNGACEECHGQPPNGDVFPNRAGAHAGHWSAVYGPAIDDCYVCHALPENEVHENGLVSFATGVDGNANGNIELSETDVCDACHSPDGPFDGVAEAKATWLGGGPVSCEGCHDAGVSVVAGVSAPPVVGDNVIWGYFATGHGRNGTVLCTQCHDKNSAHVDGQPRTYAFDTAYYGPTQSGVAYAAGYRLSYVGANVPLMIPSNYGITFDYDALLMRNTAFRLCFECHEMSKVFDDTPGDGLSTRFKASLPDPPRNYSYAWGSGADVNEHVAHLQNYLQPAWDSDWDTGTAGPGPGGWDSLATCSSCHNVHGAAGNCGSTNEPMIRDGALAGRQGYGFSYVVEDAGAGGYPQVTSTAATQANSVGAIFRYNTANMCGGSACHSDPAPPGGCSYDASGSGWDSYLEFYRPGAFGACCDTSSMMCNNVSEADCQPPLEFHAWVSCDELAPPCGLGACCYWDGVCSEVMEMDCPWDPTPGEPLWLGHGTGCDPDPCLFGACCYEWGGYCEEWTESGCTQFAEGTYLGDDTVCDFETDCNGNGRPDACDIALGTSADEDGNSVPDECELCGDLDGDTDVDGDDYAIFAGSYGRAEGDAGYVAACDYDGDGVVTAIDFQQWLMCYREFMGEP